MQGFKYWKKVLKFHMPELDDEELRKVFVYIDQDKVFARGQVRQNVFGV